jgi:hypothetical protein
MRDMEATAPQDALEDIKDASTMPPDLQVSDAARNQSGDGRRAAQSGAHPARRATPGPRCRPCADDAPFPGHPVNAVGAAAANVQKDRPAHKGLQS